MRGNVAKSKQQEKIFKVSKKIFEIYTQKF